MDNGPIPSTRDSGSPEPGDSECRTTASGALPSTYRAHTSGRRRMLWLVCILVVVSTAATCTAIAISYKAAIQSNLDRLALTAQSQARLLETIHQQQDHHDAHGADEDIAAMGRILEANLGYLGFGQTGEFTLGSREGDQIVFHLRHRHFDKDHLVPVPFDSPLAVPMRLALSKQRGTVIGLDYRGETVLAGYTPIRDHDAGLVAKMDLAEVRAPFVRAGLVAGIVMALLVGLGALLLHVVGSPLVRQLERNERRYRSLFEDAAVGMFRARLDGTALLMVNHALSAIFGRSPQELLASPVSGLLAGTVPVEDLLEQLRAAGALTNLEVSVVGADGELRDCLVSVRAHPDRGELEGSVLDVTDHRRIEEQLRLNAKALEVAADSIAITDNEGTIVWVNPAFVRHYGYSSEELVGKNPSLMKSGRHDDALFCDLWRTIRDGRTWQGEITNRRKDGTLCDDEASITPVADEQGAIRWFVSVRRDITQRRRDARELGEHRERLEQLVDQRTAALAAANEALELENEQRLGAERALERSRDLLAAIRQAQADFIGTGDPRAFFDKVLTSMLELTGSEYGFLGELCEGTEGEPYLRTFAITDIAWDESTREFYRLNAPTGLEFRNLSSLFGVTIRSGEAVIANDPANDPRAGGVPPGHPPLRAYLGVPFHVGGALVGMMGLANREGGYDQALLDFLQPLASTCGHIIIAHRNERRRFGAEQALQRAFDAQRTITSLQRLALEPRSTGEVCEGALEILLSEPGLSVQERGAIFLVADGDPDTLVMASERGMGAQERQGCAAVPFGRCHCGRAASEGQLQYSGQIDERHENTYPHMHPHGHYCVPVRSRAQVLGVICLYLEAGTSRSRQTEEFLASFATTLAAVLRAARGARDLQASEAKLRTILDQLPLMMWTTDQDGYLAYLGGSATSAMAVDPGQILGRPLAELPFGSMDGGSITSAHLRALHGKGTSYELELRGQTFLAHVQPLIGPRGEAEGCIGVAHDITPLRRLEQARLATAEAEGRAQLAEASALARARFLSSMSHELRTPLNAIIGFGRIVQRDARRTLGDAGQRYVDNIVQAGEHMLDLVNDLLELRRLEDDSASDPASPVAVGPAVMQAVELNRHLVEERGHGLELELGDELPEVRCSPRGLLQILVNLLSNAAKYTPRGGRIVLRALAGDGQTVRIEVQDNGIGIAPEDQEHLFVYWKQVGGKHEHNMQGAGIGLALCRALVQRADGSIAVRSAPGQGSTFTVTLPAAPGGLGGGEDAGRA